MNNVVRHLRRLEAEVYPPHMRQMGTLGVRSMSDLADYCEVKSTNDILVLTGTTWYFIAARNADYVEIVDFASKGGVPGIFSVVSKFMKFADGKRIRADLRVETSWPLVKALVQRYDLRIVSSHRYLWGDVEMMEVVIE